MIITDKAPQSIRYTCQRWYKNDQAAMFKVYVGESFESDKLIKEIDQLIDNSYNQYHAELNYVKDWVWLIFKKEQEKQELINEYLSVNIEDIRKLKSGEYILVKRDDIIFLKTYRFTLDGLSEDVFIKATDYNEALSALKKEYNLYMNNFLSCVELRHEP